MCGITGFIDPGESNLKESREKIQSMMTSLSHRGPDDDGMWIDQDANIALGHTRLSIIDLSDNGSQPMHSANNRYVIIYNGEIYNSSDIANELQKEGINFRGHSDTEVLLEACSRWGIPTAIEKIIGMFAFALWDKYEKTLYLARDRLGIKPLYWGRIGGLFLFASEIKSLRKHNGWNPEIDHKSFYLYIRYGYIPAPATIYKDINKLLPGHILTYKPGEKVKINKYWDIEYIARNAVSQPYSSSEADAENELDRLLSDAVSRRLVSDVPIGALLSGGIDSSAVVAMMCKNSNAIVNTYSIGFQNREYNEANYAKEVAKHLGSTHTDIYVTPDDALSLIPKLSDVYDEPFSDSSQIPTYLVSKLARQHVSVALSGDGGDEIFCGYNRYIQAGKIKFINKYFPCLLKKLMKNSIRSFSPEQWRKLNMLLPNSIRVPQFGEKLYKIADLLGKDDISVYNILISQWEDAYSPVLNIKENDSALSMYNIDTMELDRITRMQLMDALTYLPDDILTKVDRASMAVSLENRVPLLDHRLVEFGIRLPSRMKIRNGKGKWLLRKVLYKYIPSNLVDRPKMGFSIPISDWLRGPLQEWAENLIDENKLRQQGFLNPAIVKEKWREHLSGKRNWQYQIWNILMFQAWLERWY